MQENTAQYKRNILSLIVINSIDLHAIFQNRNVKYIQSVNIVIK